MSGRFGVRFALQFLVAGGLFAQAQPPYQGGPDYSAQPQGQYPGPNSLGTATDDQGQAPPDVAGPPVARLSIVNGGVSVRRGDSPDPVAAVPNAPVLAGDAIAVGMGGRAEIQFDFANRLRLGNEAEARISEMQSGRIHVEIAHGTASFSVFRDSRAQVELSTPNVSIRPLAQGLYRVWVRDDGQTVVTARAGEAEIYTQRGTERVHQGQTMFIRGSAQDPEYQVTAAVATDEWDTWNDERDRMLDSARSYQYVNPDVTGAEDLDAYGQWTNDSTYGEVWAPRVAPGWTPYGAGSWAWEDYYGWTWVGAEPWGWAPYHYGNWFRGSTGWCWWPGLRTGVFFRPALVGFFGFGNFLGVGLGFGGWGHVGWVPLAPYERFSPWYGRGGYGFGGRLINGNIANGYRNARIGNAVHGVDVGAFTSGRFTNIARLNASQIGAAALVHGSLPIRPTTNNLRFGNQQATVAPRAFTANSHFYSRSPSAPVQRSSFQQQQQGFSRTLNQPNQRAFSAGNPANSNGSSNWSRFGSPNRVAPSTPSSSRGGAGWGSFGSAPAASGAYQRYGNSPAYSQGRSYGQGSQQSLRIAPPIVHDRAYDAPARSYSAPRYAAPSYSAPHYSAPPRAAAPAPRPSGGGGGGHASAPAARSGGGGGGHAGGGGGGHHR